MSEQTAESELNKPPAPQGQVVSPTPAIDTTYSDATDSGRPTLRLKAAEQEQHESWQLIALALDAAGMGWGAWNLATGRANLIVAAGGNSPAVLDKLRLNIVMNNLHVFVDAIGRVDIDLTHYLEPIRCSRTGFVSRDRGSQGEHGRIGLVGRRLNAGNRFAESNQEIPRIDRE